MTAQQENTLTKKGSKYLHVYRQVEKEKIFSDNKDYEKFTNFLKDYFSDVNNPDKEKISFTIRGRTYHGTPRKPKSFFENIELLAYKLEPNRFDFLVKEIAPGTVEKFIRAISTRYAIYFNKKYNRSGTLFRNPYTSHQINNLSSLLYLTRDLHSNFSDKRGVSAHHYSSYPEYLGQRESKWIKSQEILSLEGVNDYKTFVESDKSEQSKSNHNLPPKAPIRFVEIILSAIILIGLSSYSVFKIETSIPNLISPLPIMHPQVAGTEDIKTEALQSQTTEIPDAKTILVIKMSDGSKSTNLYKEPNIESQKIGQVNDGDSFELVAMYARWYKIKLDNNQSGFVLAKNAQIMKEDSNL